MSSFGNTGDCRWIHALKSHKLESATRLSGYVGGVTLAERTGANICVLASSDIACVGSFLIPPLRCIMRQASFSNVESLGFEANREKKKKITNNVSKSKVKGGASTSK